jgi:hypothetical protein
VRAAFLEEWGDPGGAGRILVDTLAHAYTSYLDWLETLTAYTKLHRRKTIQDDKWGPPRVSDAQTLDQAAAMVERFHQLMLRTLKALTDLQRRTPPITIHQAGQVNLGGQQVNLSLDGRALGEGNDSLEGLPASERKAD